MVEGPWLSAREAAVLTGRSLTLVVDGMLAGALPYLKVGEDPLGWLIEQSRLEAWAATPDPAP